MTDSRLQANSVANSDVGIHVNRSVVGGGVVVRLNTEPVDIAGKNFDPYTDEGPGVAYCCVKTLRPNCSGTAAAGAADPCCVVAHGGVGPCPSGQRTGHGGPGSRYCCEL